MSGPELVVVTTTFAERSQATEMARRVIRERAAACAQVDGPIDSHYRWNNQDCQDTEWRLTLKTTTAALSRLTEIVHATHPYKQPQWVVVAVEQSSIGYRAWVVDSVIVEGASQV